MDSTESFTWQMLIKCFHDQEVHGNASWSIKVSIAAQKFATSTDWKGSDTTWELRMMEMERYDKQKLLNVI